MVQLPTGISSHGFESDCLAHASRLLIRCIWIPAATRVHFHCHHTWEKVCVWICSNSSNRPYLVRVEWNSDIAAVLLHSSLTWHNAMMTSGRVRRETKLKASLCSLNGYSGISRRPVTKGKMLFKEEESSHYSSCQPAPLSRCTSCPYLSINRPSKLGTNKKASGIFLGTAEPGIEDATCVWFLIWQLQ